MAFSYPTVNSLKNKLDYFLDKGKSEDVFSGASAGVYFPSQEGRKKLTSSSGRTSCFATCDDIERSTFFDLASLTKPLSTTLAILTLINKKVVALDDDLGLLLERKIQSDKRGIRLFHLLNHCSGLASYQPFYKTIFGSSPVERKKRMVEEILSSPLSYEPGKRAEYSDLGFILLGRVVEIKSGRSLDRYLVEKVLAPTGLVETIFFNPLDRIRPIDPFYFAATENCPWRKKPILGEVHDENTYLIGGVSGQAGLFGNVEGVLSLADYLLDMWKGRQTHPNISNSDLAHFFKVPGIVKNSSWALGFDTPSPQGSSAGSYLSRQSVGHLGFTGTSFWIDPERELVIVLLTNRIHPTRKNDKIRAFRPLFHDYIASLFS